MNDSPTGTSSPSPPTQTAFDFSQALIRIKAGKRCFRAGWGGNKDFVFLVSGSTFKVNRPPLLGIYAEGTEISYHGHIDLRTHDGSIMVWSPTQDDILLADWFEAA